MTFDPLAPDAPLLSLLSIKENPLLLDMSEDQLIALVRKLRQGATSPPTLAAMDEEAGRRVAQKTPRVTKASEKKTLLDSL